MRSTAAPSAAFLSPLPDPAGGSHRRRLRHPHELECQVAVGNVGIEGTAHGSSDPTPATASLTRDSVGSSATTAIPARRTRSPPTIACGASDSSRKHPRQEDGCDGLEEREDPGRLRRHVAQEHRIDQGRDPGEDDAEQEHGHPLAGVIGHEVGGEEERRREHDRSHEAVPEGNRQRLDARVEQPLGEDHEHRERQRRADAAGERDPAEGVAVLAGKRDERDADAARDEGAEGDVRELLGQEERRQHGQEDRRAVEREHCERNRAALDRLEEEPPVSGLDDPERDQGREVRPRAEEAEPAADERDDGQSDCRQPEPPERERRSVERHRGREDCDQPPGRCEPGEPQVPAHQLTCCPAPRPRSGRGSGRSPSSSRCTG